MPLCADYKFSRAVLYKISFVSSLSLSFSSLTAFRSAVEATSESDNPRFSTRLESLRFLLPCRRCFYLICITRSDRETQSLIIYRARLHAIIIGIELPRWREKIFEFTTSSYWMCNHANGNPNDRQLFRFSSFLAQKFRSAKFNVSRIDDKRRVWLAVATFDRRRRLFNYILYNICALWHIMLNFCGVIPLLFQLSLKVRISFNLG